MNEKGKRGNVRSTGICVPTGVDEFQAKVDDRLVIQQTTAWDKELGLAAIDRVRRDRKITKQEVPAMEALQVGADVSNCTIIFPVREVLVVPNRRSLQYRIMSKR